MPGSAVRLARQFRVPPGWVFIAVGAVLPGCASIERNLLEKYDLLSARVEKSIDARTPSSLARWERSVKNGRAVLEHTEVRSAMLLADCAPESVELRSRHMPRGAVRWGLDVKGSLYLGTAVPISGDGYFLTAAHCVGSGPLTLITCVRGGLMKKAAARVVWSGEQEVDLAILHAPLMPVAPFVPDRITVPKTSDPVGLFGWRAPTARGGRVAAGKTLAVSEPHRSDGGAEWRIVYHDAPCLSGNSGGPLVTAAGELIGINHQAGVGWSTLIRSCTGLTGSPAKPLAGYTGETVAPDPAWLSRMMEEDRAERRSGRTARTR